MAILKLVGCISENSETVFKKLGAEVPFGPLPIDTDFCVFDGGLTLDLEKDHRRDRIELLRLETPNQTST